MNKQKEENNPRCLQCGSTIEYGRNDKVFCSTTCKNAYHNQQSHDARQIRSRIFHGLNDNRDILKRLLRAKLTTISISEAAIMGFNPAFFTGLTRYRGRQIYHCFEYSYWLTSTHIRCIKVDIPPKEED